MHGLRPLVNFFFLGGECISVRPEPHERASTRRRPGCLAHTNGPIVPLDLGLTVASPRHTHAVPMLMPMHMRGACPGEHAQYYHACAYMPRCRTGRQAMRRRRRLVSCRPAPRVEAHALCADVFGSSTALHHTHCTTPTPVPAAVHGHTRHSPLRVRRKRPPRCGVVDAHDACDLRLCGALALAWAGSNEWRFRLEWGHGHLLQ